MIKVHLVKSSEVSTETFTKVIDLLQAIPGKNSHLALITRLWWRMG